MNYKKVLAVRYRLIIKYTGILVILTALALILPLLSLVFYPGETNYIIHFIYSSIFAFVVGGLMYFYGHSSDNSQVDLTLKEGSIIVLLSWILAMFFSAIPFLWGMKMSWTHAIFEVVSGWTTTGLSVMNVETTPAIFLLWRSLMQLLGGAGLAVIALSYLLPVHGMGLYRAEARNDKLLPHVKKSTAMIMRIYGGFVLSGIFLYWLVGMDLFSAINHAMAALSTGGFSTKSASIGYWPEFDIELITIILMLLGTINFASHFTLLQGKVKTFFRNGEIRFMLLIIGFLTPLLMFTSLNLVYASLGTNLRITLFQVVSAISTTGFSTIDFNTWPLFANFIIIILMIIGGGTGSTAGGIKQYRIYIMIKSIFWEIKEQFSPRNQVKENYIWKGDNKEYINAEHIKEIANYIMLYLLTFAVGVAIFLLSGYGLQESLFEFGSALGTVGLSIGITSASAPNHILITEIAGMFLGRLEFLIIFFAAIKIIKDLKYISK